MTQVHVFVTGFVQGVGYRQFVKSNARRIGLTGWVRNLSDGRVEAVFQSSASSDREGKKAIEQMVLLCRTGPTLAEVKDIEVSWGKAGEVCDSFEAIPTA